MEGIHRLVDAVSELGTVIVAAPDGPRSGGSSAISCNTMLMPKRIDDYNGAQMWSVNGTPADCVKLALNAIVSRSGAQIEKLRLELPNSTIESKRIAASYRMNGDAPDMQSLRFEGSLNAPRSCPRSAISPTCCRLHAPASPALYASWRLSALSKKSPMTRTSVLCACA